MITAPNKLNDLQLHNQFKFVTTRERKILHLVIIHIQEIAKRDYYLKEHESLQKYLEKEFGYSHTAAQRRIDAARLASVVPSVAQKIESGELNLSQINVVSNAIKQKEKIEKANLSIEAKAQLIEKVEKTSVFQTQQICAEILDLPLIESEKIKIQKDHSTRLEITLNAEQMQKLEQVKGLIAHKHLSLKRTMSISDILETCFDLIIEKKLGVEKKLGAEKNLGTEVNSGAHMSFRTEMKSSAKDKSKAKQTQADTASVSKRVSDQASTEYEARERNSDEKDEGKGGNEEKGKEEGKDKEEKNKEKARIWKSITPKRRQWVFRHYRVCQHHTSQGKICGSLFNLEVDHLVPLWAGGDSRRENLTLLCRNHNQYKYRRQAGFGL